MSIPKEPRQLMINLMYLVLTAMLALNVSAEIINAFFMIHEGIQTTNTTIEESNTQVIKGISTQASEKTNYKPLEVAAKEAQEITKELITFIDGQRDELTELSGGKYPEDYEEKKKAGRPKGYKDKDTPQRYFVDEGRGAELRSKIEETRSKLVALVENVQKQKIKGTNIKTEDIENLKKQLTLKIDDATWKESGKESWEAYIFGYMPVAACYPLLSKFQNDAKTSEAAIISFLAKQIGATTIEFDKFEPVASASKSYLLKGETYEAEVFLSAFSSQADISVRVNGNTLPVQDGKATYKSTPSTVGTQSYKAAISVRNPITNETETYTKEFQYEVGAPAASVSADKMNVFYIGVDNPISLAASGVSTSQLKVSTSGPIKLNKKSASKYVVRPTAKGDATITLSGGPLKATPFKFRIKRIPDPVVKLGNIAGGRIGNGTMKAQGGLIPWLENFDFEAKCRIESFEAFYIPNRGDPQRITGNSGQFTGQMKAAARAAKPGDAYNFTEVKVRCPGDPAARKIGGPSIVIK